ncbi:hypothetical protein B0H19DRAFT_1227224 [Mycena capillaripes]|nr:hypothetical protein B0H19DRAFT_1227224 [Mycena capillaripes]
MISGKLLKAVMLSSSISLNRPPMLLLLSLIHGIATNHPVSGHTLDAREEPGSCDDINNCRTLFGIVSGCLATIFACTWVSVHPNVPPPNQSQLALSWRRFCLMLVAVVAPELMVGFAARQFLDARLFSKEYGVSRTHGFFFAMGGFVSRSGHHPIVTRKQLEQCPEYLAAIRSVKVRDIEDKSKGDAMSKGVVLLQGLWFTAQSLARLHQHIPVTELEVATLAFQIVNIFIWLLWWNKPLDIQQPILVGPGNESVQDSARRLSLRGVIETMVRGSFPAFEPVLSTSVPSFCSADGHWKRDTHLPSITIEALVGTIFGVIHCAAWNAHFPSTTEMWMWRSCTLVVAAIPTLLAVAYIPTEAYISLEEKMRGLWETFGMVFMLAIMIYTGARLFLIILPFTALRGLPPGALVDVNWSMYIPHVGL